MMASEIYIFQLGDTPYVKLGYSGNAARRLADWQTMLPIPIRVLGVFEGTSSTETKLHRRLSKWRTRGEWYQLCDRFLVKLHRITPIRIEARGTGETLKTFSPSEWDPGSLKKRVMTLEKRSEALQTEVTELRKERAGLRRKVAALQRELRREKSQSPTGRARSRIAVLEDEVRQLRRETIRLRDERHEHDPRRYHDDDGLSEEIRRTMAEAEAAVLKMEESEA